jgi:hypothetical protein
VAGGSAKTEGGTAVNQTVPVVDAASDEAVLPERVQEALGQLVGAAKEGLLALSVEALRLVWRFPVPPRRGVDAFASRTHWQERRTVSPRAQGL